MGGEGREEASWTGSESGSREKEKWNGEEGLGAQRRGRKCDTMIRRGGGEERDIVWRLDGTGRGVDSGGETKKSFSY